ncbi:hypothetical protein [Candidatus Magnetobacterium casense]|uniref:hypothetical protein n=1 Tax=Candidatus Magnetobacterium casense TaxID=1455061 RepID=UPI001C488C70|nr:hypothetical protein [Candidatus Magnetobacterium casensis]
MQDERNELIRTIVQKCATCNHGRANLQCHKKSCHNKQVRLCLKKIQQIDKK